MDPIPFAGRQGRDWPPQSGDPGLRHLPPPEAGVRPSLPGPQSPQRNPQEAGLEGVGGRGQPVRQVCPKGLVSQGHLCWEPRGGVGSTAKPHPPRLSGLTRTARGSSRPPHRGHRDASRATWCAPRDACPRGASSLPPLHSWLGLETTTCPLLASLRGRPALLGPKAKLRGGHKWAGLVPTLGGLPFPQGGPGGEVSGTCRLNLCRHHTVAASLGPGPATWRAPESLCVASGFPFSRNCQGLLGCAGSAWSLPPP